MIEDDPVARHVARQAAAACLGQDSGRHIERLATSAYFTADYEGDELIVADQQGRAAASLFDEIERVAGAQLVLRPDLSSIMSTVLGFSDEAAASVLARLADA